MKQRILVGLFVLAISQSVHAQKFLPDDPVQQDPDCQPVTGPLAEAEYSRLYSLMKNTFGSPGDPTPRKAVNINTLGEVPDSSWFTNRIGHAPMSMEDLVRGPNTGNGPDSSQPWTIVSAKFEGVTPGFVIQDGKGDHYFIKFDSKGYPQMGTSAEAVSTKFFYAFGYHVPENYLTFVDRNNLVIAPDAMMIVDKTTKRKMKEKDVDHIFKKVAYLPDGRVQAVASKVVQGEVIGTFLFHGTRTDDPNDIFMHEDRRELRGLGVFAAWLNHDELQTQNTLDTRQDPGRCVQHYLIDFNSIFGSGNTKPQDPRSGNEYYYEKGPTMKAAYTLGIWDRPWRHVKYPKYVSVGRFESVYFQPEKWKSEYPNTAFNKMDNEDAFWATKIVMKFSDDRVRALVQTGQYIDKEAEEYLVQTLIERRNKVVNYYLNQVNPLDSFAVQTNGEHQELSFKNLGIDAGLATAASYKYQWFQFDNQQNSTKPVADAGTSSSPAIAVPPGNSGYFMVRIQTTAEGHPGWEKAVDVYIRNEGTPAVVGIERQN